MWVTSSVSSGPAYRVPALQENANAFSRFFFNGRVMRPVSSCDPSTTILGFKSSIPIFVSGAALAKLGHPDGEANITRGAAKTGIIQMVSSNASLSYAEMVAAASPGQTLFFQLYKHTEDSIAEKRVAEAVELGYKAIFLTVDAVVPSNRELDIRAPFVLEDLESGRPPVYVDGQPTSPLDDSRGLGTAGGLIVGYDADMTFEKVSNWYVMSVLLGCLWTPLSRPFHGFARSPNYPSLSKVSNVSK